MQLFSKLKILLKRMLKWQNYTYKAGVRAITEHWLVMLELGHIQMKTRKVQNSVDESLFNFFLNCALQIVGPYTSIRTVKKNSVITLKSPPRPVTFSLPISSPRPTSSYSSHFCNSKSSLARPDSVATIPPLFSSLETFPPLSTAINIHTQETVQSNTTPSSTSLSAPISVLSKPRIPSLMDLKISLPANPSTSNADAIIITKRKGKPRLPTIADAFNQSLLNSPNLRSSKLKNRQLAIAVLPQN